MVLLPQCVPTYDEYCMITGWNSSLILFRFTKETASRPRLDLVHGRIGVAQDLIGMRIGTCCIQRYANTHACEDRMALDNDDAASSC